MATSRKYYEKVAQILNDNAAFAVRTGRPDAVAVVADIASDLADVFESDNPSFDRERFLKAVATA